MTVWDQMIGQTRAVLALQRAAQEARDVAAGEASSRSAMSHAWLITGPPGSGRSVAARAFAAALQCTGEPVGCGTCPGCRTTLAGTNANVQIHETDLVMFTRSDVDNWLSDAYSAPLDNLWRVTVVEDADRMAERTSNILLKSIEEPPPRGVWLLCAPSTEDVLPTIRSRCRHLALVTPAVEDVADYLMVEENADKDEALTAATLAQSHVGFARALLRNPSLREEVRSMFTGPLYARTFADALFAAESMHSQAKKAADRQAKSASEQVRATRYAALGLTVGKPVPKALRSAIKELDDDEKRRERRALKDVLDRALVDLLGFYRDVITKQLDASVGIVNVDLVNEVKEIAGQSTPQETLQRVDAVEKARWRLQGNAAPLLVLEAMGVTLVDPTLTGVDPFDSAQ